MKVYVDLEYSCFAQKSEGLREVESDFFDGKCNTLIECFKFVPAGESYTDEHGLLHSGAIWNYKPITSSIERIQAAYEHEQLEVVTADRDDLLSDIAALIEEVYEMDSEIME